MDRRQLLLTAPALLTVASAGFAQEETAPEILEMALGSDAEDAPVLIEYASYTCPACKRFHEVTWPVLKSEYIDTGKIRFVNRELLRNRADLWAAMIARCSGGEKYFGIVDMLFKQQAEWTNGSEADIADNLRKIGLLAGFDKDTVNACFTDRDYALALVEKTQADQEADAVTATPTLFLNGQRLTAVDPDSMRAALDAAIGG